MKIAVMGSGGLGRLFRGAARAGRRGRAFRGPRRALAGDARERHRDRSGPEPIHVARVSATDDPPNRRRRPRHFRREAVGYRERRSADPAAWSGPDTAIVSFQNGVLKDDILRAAYDAAQIMGGVGYVATTIAGPA